jgi:hypothetical protein
VEADDRAVLGVQAKVLASRTALAACVMNRVVGGIVNTAL